MVQMDWVSTIKTNIFILRLSGIWPKSNEKYGFNLYTIWAFTSVTFFGFIHALFQTIKLATNLNNLEIVTETAFISISELLVVLKVIYLARNNETIKQLMAVLKSDIFQPKTQQQIALILPSIKVWKFMYRLLWGSASMVVAARSLLPFTDGSIKNRALPFISWYPYDAKKSPLFEFTYIHQTLSVMFLATVNANLDTLIAAMSMYTGAQFDILCDNLKNLESVELEMNLVGCVKHHREITEFVKKLNLVFNWTILAQFFTSAISIGFSLFLITTASPTNKEFYSVLFYGTAAFLEIFIYCWFGNEVEIKSNQVPIAAFQSNWISATEQTKKNLLFFIMMSQKPLRISALNLFHLSIENFLKILKTAWSYFAFVSQFKKL